MAQTCLVRLLPTAGYRWPDEPPLLGRRRNDQKVVEVLAAYGCNTCSEVEAAFASMVKDTTELARTVHLARGTLQPYEVSAIVRMDIPWAAEAVSDGVFTRLFNDLVEARARWCESPRPPFEVSEHGALAHALDEFDLVAGGGWSSVDIELFELAGGFAEEEEEMEGRGDGEDEEMGGVEGENMGEAKEEEDGELREVRERLAGASLGEEMDWEQ